MKINLFSKKDGGMGKSQERGFTLIELIITISILAVLVTILVVAINPAEQLARSRDSKRTADLAGLQSAMNLYLATATSTIDLDGSADSNAKCTDGATPTAWFNTTGSVSTSTVTSTIFTAKSVSSTQTIGSAGWLPARMDQTPGGAPLSVLPLDPSGQGANTTYYYMYACKNTNKQYELGAILESTYFLTDLDMDGKDGGSSSTMYEAGTNLNLL